MTDVLTKLDLVLIRPSFSSLLIWFPLFLALIGLFAALNWLWNRQSGDPPPTLTRRIMGGLFLFVGMPLALTFAWWLGEPYLWSLVSLSVEGQPAVGIPKNATQQVNAPQGADIAYAIGTIAKVRDLPPDFSLSPRKRFAVSIKTDSGIESDWEEEEPDVVFPDGSSNRPHEGQRIRRRFVTSWSGALISHSSWVEVGGADVNVAAPRAASPPVGPVSAQDEFNAGTQARANGSKDASQHFVRCLKLLDGKPQPRNRYLTACCERALGEIELEGKHFHAAYPHFQRGFDILTKLVHEDPGLSKLNAMDLKDLAPAPKSEPDLMKLFSPGLLDKIGDRECAYQYEWAMSYRNLGNYHHQIQEYDVALKHYNSCLGALTRLSWRGLVDVHKDLALTYEQVATACRASCDLEGAEANLRRALQSWELVSGEGFAKEASPALLRMQLGDLKEALNEPEAAIQFYREALLLQQAKVQSDPLWRHEIARSEWKLGCMHALAGRFDEAIGLFKAAIRDFEQVKNVSAQERTFVEERLRYVLKADIALGELSVLMRQPKEDVPGLLALRLDRQVYRGQSSQAAETARLLADLHPKSIHTLVFAACGFGECAKLAEGWKGSGPLDVPTKLSLQAKAGFSSSHIDAAFKALNEAIDLGWDDLAELQGNYCFASLRFSPKWKEVVARVGKRVTLTRPGEEN